MPVMRSTSGPIAMLTSRCRSNCPSCLASSVVALIEAVHSFGLFAKCYNC